MRNRDTAFMLGVLLFVCGSLLYLDWRRQGEIELLHERVDTLEGRPGRNASGLANAHSVDTPKPPARSTVERILSASDDHALTDLARGKA